MNPTFDISSAETMRKLALNRKVKELSEAKTDHEKAAAHAAYGYNLDVILTYIFNAAKDAKQINVEMRMSS